MRRVLAPLFCVLAAGCAGGTPQPAQVKHAARAWAGSRLHPSSLMVTLVVVTPDQRRARVRLLADGRRWDVRLARAGGSWRVTGAARHRPSS